MSKNIKYVAPVIVGPDIKPTNEIINDGTPVITHHELCVCNDHPHYGHNDHLRSTCSYCQCFLIKKIEEKLKNGTN